MENGIILSSEFNTDSRYTLRAEKKLQVGFKGVLAHILSCTQWNRVKHLLIWTPLLIRTLLETREMIFDYRGILFSGLHILPFQSITHTHTVEHFS